MSIIKRFFNKLDRGDKIDTGIQSYKTSVITDILLRIPPEIQIYFRDLKNFKELTDKDKKYLDVLIQLIPRLKELRVNIPRMLNYFDNKNRSVCFYGNYNTEKEYEEIFGNKEMFEFLKNFCLLFNNNSEVINITYDENDKMIYPILKDINSVLILAELDDKYFQISEENRMLFEGRIRGFCQNLKNNHKAVIYVSAKKPSHIEMIIGVAQNISIKDFID